MTRLPRVPLLLLLLAGASPPGVHGEDSPPTQPSSHSPTPAPAPRVVSPPVAALLRAAAPKFVPPATDNARAEKNASSSEPDQPRNGIVRLPRYLVEEPKIFVPNHRDVLTARGRLDLALKRHPGLRVGNIWFLRNDGIALFMLEEEERLERLREVKDLVSLLPAGRQKGAAEQTAHQLAIRPFNWTTPASHRNR